MSTELKSGIDTMRDVLKEELSVLQKSLQTEDPKDQEDLHTVQQFLDHYHDCGKDDCEVSQLKEKESKNWFLKGISIGKRIK